MLLFTIGVKAVGQVAPQLETLLLSNCMNVSVEAARALEMSMPALKHLEIHGLQQERMVSRQSFFYTYCVRNAFVPEYGR
jgi:hypothetical protein